MPVWSDKLLQEVIRTMLEAYFEPQFTDHSHGFRPERGCHTALREIYHHWRGATWFIEGDISHCFESSIMNYSLKHSASISTMDDFSISCKNSSMQDTWKTGHSTKRSVEYHKAELSRLLQCCKKSARVRIPGGNPAFPPSRRLRRWISRRTATVSVVWRRSLHAGCCNM